MDLIALIDVAIANAENVKTKSETNSCSSSTEVNNNVSDIIAKLRAERASVLSNLASSNVTGGASVFVSFVCAGFAKGL